MTVVGVVVAPSGVPVTLTVMSPAGVPGRTVIVKTLEPVGVTFVGLNEVQVNCWGGAGIATQDKATSCAVPEVNVAVIVTVSLVPDWTVTGPLFDNE